MGDKFLALTKVQSACQISSAELTFNDVSVIHCSLTTIATTFRKFKSASVTSHVFVLRRGDVVLKLVQYLLFRIPANPFSSRMEIGKPKLKFRLTKNTIGRQQTKSLNWRGISLNMQGLFNRSSHVFHGT